MTIIKNSGTMYEEVDTTFPTFLGFMCGLGLATFFWFLFSSVFESNNYQAMRDVRQLETNFQTTCAVYLQGQVIKTPEYLYCVDMTMPSNVRIESIIDDLSEHRRIQINE